VAKASLLPVLAGHDRLKVTTLVDRDEARARALASAYSVAHVVTDLNALGDDVDAVVLATPPAHHAPATLAQVAKGRHVLVEKPMAITSADAEAMVAAADRAGVVLTVGLYRRMLPSVQLLRAMIQSGDYGAPVAVDAEEGGMYGWQLATLAGLTREAGGGGPLIDIGSHVIDEILYVLPGEPVLAGYEDNSKGGIETDCVATFSIRTPARTVPVRLELSRTRELRNSIRVECEHATLELQRPDFTQVLVHPRRASGAADSSAIRLTAEWARQAPYIGYQAFRAEMDDWANAILDGTAPTLAARTVVPVVRLIEQCYASRTRMPEPWYDDAFAGAPAVVRAAGMKRKRVLVTGAGGFLGGRAVELLAERYGVDAVGLVRSPGSAARLARGQWPIVLGDISSAADMDRALQGCDAVVHCAVGTSWKADETRRVTVDGTRTVAEAAFRAGVRMIHISTMFVHRRDASGTLDEHTPLEPPAEDSYGQNKLMAEKAVQAAAAKGLFSVILRPTRIYGPLSKTFTIRPLGAIASGHFALQGDADVPANMVYVDNVVDAIARALDAPDAAKGSAYLITDAEQVSLREFYTYFAEQSGAVVRVVPAPPAAADRRRPGFVSRCIAGLKTIALAPEVRALVHRVLDTEPIGTLPKRLWERSPRMQARLLTLFKVDAAVVYRPGPAETEEDLLYYGEPGLVSSRKAEQEIGYTPPIDRERAMALTLAWSRSARLIR